VPAIFSGPPTPPRAAVCHLHASLGMRRSHSDQRVQNYCDGFPFHKQVTFRAINR
jgi:hypothetical protein